MGNSQQTSYTCAIDFAGTVTVSDGNLAVDIPHAVLPFIIEDLQRCYAQHKAALAQGGGEHHG